MALVDEIVSLINTLKTERELFRIHQHTGTRLQLLGAKPKPRLKLPLLGRLYLAASPYIFAWGLVAPALLWLYYQPITEQLFTQYMADGASWPTLAAAFFGGAAALLSFIVGVVIRLLTRAYNT